MSKEPAKEPSGKPSSGVIKEEPRKKAQQPAGGPSRNKHYKLKFYSVVVLVFGLAALLIWQLVRMSAMEKAYQAERAALVEAHEKELDAQAEQLLRTSGALLRWAIVAQLVADSFESIEARIRPLVREESVVVVAVADASNKIRIATNHKLEGSTLASAFPGIPEGGAEMTVAHIEGRLVAVIPVVEDGRELGRAVISYEHRHGSESPH